jgi:hypothetical protein
MVYKPVMATYNYIPFALVIVREVEYTVTEAVKKSVNGYPKHWVSQFNRTNQNKNPTGGLLCQKILRLNQKNQFING